MTAIKAAFVFVANPALVKIICADVLDSSVNEQFEIVTMVGSTVLEGKDGTLLIEKAMRLVKPGGAFYYHSMDENEDCNIVF